ncbi:phosphonate C-P lyase system protein PhnG [Martelella alba]|uniref:Phosphonate C-P lyase system protein PhnG n=1 Tax=Martelella alba TaxID=2590451 RepID=A0ABY2SP18_9HYPH|nr:phosphonate C-P lyase system protein PhnG [Martelella alba]TKI07761.1 phosphonate C-P lyase system protein PhnG [Martelella alba]
MQTSNARQHWMSVLSSSPAEVLRAHWQALRLLPHYERVRAPEIGLTQLQGRMGATGRRFVLGDMTVTRAVIRLENGTYGYGYTAGRDKDHAELCALLDALLQTPEHRQRLEHRIIEPLAARRRERQEERGRAIAASRVDFFTLVRGDN